MNIENLIIKKLAESIEGIYTMEILQYCRENDVCIYNDELLKKIVNILLRLKEDNYISCIKKGRDYLWTSSPTIDKLKNTKDVNGIDKKESNYIIDEKSSFSTYNDNIVILNSSHDTDCVGHYEVSFIIKNNDLIPHKVCVQAIFNDKNKLPVSESTFGNVIIIPGEIKKIKLKEYEEYLSKKIVNYELIIKKS